MIFTVVRYLPILEEETPGHRVEMTKKAQAGGAPNNSDTDDDDPDDEKTDLYFDHCHQSLSGLQPEHSFPTKYHTYLHPVEKIHTPPPQT